MNNYHQIRITWRSRLEFSCRLLLCYYIAELPLLPDFLAKRQLVNPWTGSWYRPERHASLIESICSGSRINSLNSCVCQIILARQKAKNHPPFDEWPCVWVAVWVYINFYPCLHDCKTLIYCWSGKAYWKRPRVHSVIIFWLRNTYVT